MILEDGSLRARWIGRHWSLGVCLDAPLPLDTSQWQMRFLINGQPAVQTEFEDPYIRAGTTLCFGQHIPEAVASNTAAEICGELRDDFTRQRFHVPCFTAAYEADPAIYYELYTRAWELVGQRLEQPYEDAVAAMEVLADEVNTQGYPMLSLYLRFNAVDLARRQGQLDSALESLNALPSWLWQPEAMVSASMAHFQRARIDLAANRPRQAWERLTQAEELARRYGSALRTAIVIEQATILGRAGVPGESIRRLVETLEDSLWKGDPGVEPAAHGLLAWLRLTDPDADPEELRQVARHLAAAAPASIARDHREQANQWINEAYLAVRQGNDPSARLQQARELLASAEGGPRNQFLLGWTHVVEGLAALRQGDPHRAAELCAAPVGSEGHPRLAARAWSCLGHAHEQLGELAVASEAFEQALLRHQLAVPDLGQFWPLAPGWRVDDFYQAARVAVLRDDPERAWRILAALDRAAAEGTACSGEAAKVDRLRLQRRRQVLLSKLILTEPPHSSARQQQLQPIRRSLLRALDELQRSLVAECRDDEYDSVAEAQWRAVPLEREILLLQRRADGRVEVARRTPMPHIEVRQHIATLEAARDEGQLGDNEWRRLALPLAQALVPNDLARLGPEAHYALHGILQRVPLGALPTHPDRGRRWLAEWTTPVLRPSRAVAKARTRAGAKKPLFVVDPLRDLPTGTSSAEIYRGLFPEAVVLFGQLATRQRVTQTLAAASFLHVDSHGLHQPAFPLLSGLQMSDGVLTLADFLTRADGQAPSSLAAAEISTLAFANLSGCHTGKEAVSGDSGRYGLAGALATRGVPWVVASDTAMEDQVLGDFNEVFYGEISRGRRVAKAYAAGLDRLRDDYPAVSWSGLRLIAAPASGHPRGANHLTPGLQGQ